MNCVFCVNFVGEDNNSSIQVMITRFKWIALTSMPAVREKPVKHNQSLTHYLPNAVTTIAANTKNRGISSNAVNRV